MIVMSIAEPIDDWFHALDRAAIAFPQNARLAVREGTFPVTAARNVGRGNMAVALPAKDEDATWLRLTPLWTFPSCSRTGRKDRTVTFSRCFVLQLLETLRSEGR